MTTRQEPAVSVIVPTIGRPESLANLLTSLTRQTCRPLEVLVADGSGTEEIAQLADGWRAKLNVRVLLVSPPNAVRQRQAAIGEARGDLLLLLDDDVVLEPDCLEQMLTLIAGDPSVVAVMADFSNQSWPAPTRAWRLYLRYVRGLKEGAWQGQVVGPLLRYGYNPVPATPQPMEWLGAGNSLVTRSAYDRAGGFSDFFLHRCTMNEDVDLGLKLRRVGRILFCPAARMAHYHAPGGRVLPGVAAEDDLFNRFVILRQTRRDSAARALGWVGLFFSVETASQFVACLRRTDFGYFFECLAGRLRAFGRILFARRTASSS
jgi:GT2 family glycosyltransferase